MRNRNDCPICSGKAGRVEKGVYDGKEVLKYWHTDLEHTKEYCIEFPDGSGIQVCKGKLGPTGPRA